MTSSKRDMFQEHQKMVHQQQEEIDDTSDAVKYSMRLLQQQKAAMDRPYFNGNVYYDMPFNGQKTGFNKSGIVPLAGVEEVNRDWSDQNKQAMRKGERFRAGVDSVNHQQQLNKQEPAGGDPQLSAANSRLSEQLQQILGQQIQNCPRATMNHVAGNADLEAHMLQRERQLAMSAGLGQPARGHPPPGLASTMYPGGMVQTPQGPMSVVYSANGNPKPGQPLAPMMPGLPGGVPAQPPSAGLGAMGHQQPPVQSHLQPGQIHPGYYSLATAQQPWAQMPPVQYAGPNFGLAGFNQPCPPPTGGPAGPHVSSTGRLQGGDYTRGAGRIRRLRSEPRLPKGPPGSMENHQGQIFNPNEMAYVCYGHRQRVHFAAGADGSAINPFHPDQHERQGPNGDSGGHVRVGRESQVTTKAPTGQQALTQVPLMRGPSTSDTNDALGIGCGWPYVTARGTIALRLHGRQMVEMTCDQAIRVVTYEHNVLLTIDATGMSAAMVHPNGRMHQHNSRVEVVVYENDGNNKYAKMWYKGVSFTSERSSLVYLVDEGGTRTTSDRFSPQLHAPAFATSSVFLNGSCHSCETAFSQCYTILESTYDYFKTKNGTDVWVINGIKITQSEDMTVTVFRDSNENGRQVRRKIKTSPEHGSGFVTTPMIHATASMGQNPHLFVRRGERRLHKDANSFMVRNGGHSAGFDERGRLKVF